MEDGVNLATKVIVGDFNFAMVKMDREGGNKTHFIDAIPIIPCQNSPLVMGLRIYGEGRTPFPLSSSATIDSLAQDSQQMGQY